MVPNLRTLKPKQLFLLDAFGAALSAFFLGFVLVKYQVYIGMPENVLYILALIPCLFIIYDLLCYVLLKDNWRPYLRIIAYANLLYCDTTLILSIYHFKKLTTLGLTYFTVELLLIIALSMLELRATTRPTP